MRRDKRAAAVIRKRWRAWLRVLFGWHENMCCSWLPAQKQGTYYLRRKSNRRPLVRSA